MTPKAKTKEEVREEFLDVIRDLSFYWSNLPDKTDKEKCDGLAFSVLNIFDGTSAYLPAMNISLSPHENDKQFFIDEDGDWYENEMIINDDCMLHELWCHKKGQ